jgi:hypothetical protein
MDLSYTPIHSTCVHDRLFLSVLSFEQEWQWCICTLNVQYGRNDHHRSCLGSYRLSSDSVNEPNISWFDVRLCLMLRAAIKHTPGS